MSPGPGTVIEDLRVPFARPRERAESRDLVTEPEFIAIKRHLLALLRHRQPTLPAPRLSPLGDGRVFAPTSPTP
jgi:NitT/TauT family transport system ATP-binding protein